MKKLFLNISIAATGILALFTFLGGFSYILGPGVWNIIMGYCMMFAMVLLSRHEMRHPNPGIGT